MGLLMFGAAGTFHYWQGWIYLSIFTGASAVITAYLMKHDPGLLERRMRGGPTAEKRPKQRLIMVCASFGFIALLVLPALDFRLRGTLVSSPVVLLGDVLVVAGFYFISVVYRENSFTSATIEVARGQTVISTGPYAIVRHPMYASALLYLLGTPLALGSYRGLWVVGAMMPFLLWRLLDEERFLADNLPGYTKYQTHVRYRLLPFLW